MDDDDAAEPEACADVTLPALDPAVGGSDAGGLATFSSQIPAGKQQTAKRAVTILEEAGLGFVEPTSDERRSLTVGFAMVGKVLYGAAFDVVQLAREIDLSDPAAIAANLNAITVCEVKSTRKDRVGADFRGYFFDLTTAELLVAQSLGEQYKFAFVNTLTQDHIELSLTELFGRARKIYPKWAVQF